MKENPSPSSWRPSYPDPKDQQVGMGHCTMQTYISDHRPVISISDYPFENPACFWIDSAHIYARLNWGQWCAVEPSTPNFAAAVCASHYCQMSQILDNEIHDMTAPVYHIAELPHELFVGILRRDSSKETLRQRKNKAISFLEDSIPAVVDAIGFKHVSLEGNNVDLVVSSDDFAILFAVYPEDADCSAAPPGAAGKHTDPESLEIPASVLDDLVRCRTALGEMEPSAELRMAIVASSKTLESMRNHWAEELAEKEIELVEYPEYEEYLLEHFPLLNDKDDGDEE